MSWIGPDEYNQEEQCSICLEKYGVAKAIYRTTCNHIFHNDCLDDYCEIKQGIIECPMCRTNVGELCNNVSAFKSKSLGSPTKGEPTFNENQHVLNIYNRLNGGKRRKIKTKVTKNKNKRTRRRRR